MEEGKSEDVGDGDGSGRAMGGRDTAGKVAIGER